MKNTAFITAFATRIVSAGDEGKIDKQQADETFAVLLLLLCPNFTVECVKSSKRIEPGTTQIGDTECLTDAHDVDLLMHQLNAKQLPNRLRQVVHQLQTNADTCDIIAFEAFYLPLLNRLIKRETTQSSLVDLYRPLFSRVLFRYIQRYVQIEPPAASLSCDPEGCGSCSDCRILDRFLIDPKLKSKDFPVSKQRRHHLHEMLNDTPHTHETDRSRGDTLVVQKKPSSGSERKHKEWRKRFVKAQAQIKSFDQRGLQNILGESYQPIIRLRGARRGEKT